MKDMKPYNINVFFGFDLSVTEFSKLSNDFYKNSTTFLYKIYLPEYTHLIKDLKKFLDNKENTRADKYYKETDRNRFIICRSLLKFALANYTQSDIKSISIELLSNKKPYLSKHPNVFFNVSHSGNYAVLAISNASIGIDIEYIDVDYSFQEILPSIFNEDEIRFINKANHKTKAFYRLWTRKEAFVKALGKGIDDDFSKIPCMDGLHYLDSSLIKSSQNWQVYNFKMENENYLGAIARPINNISDDKKIHFFMFPHTIEDIMKMDF